MDTSKSNDGTVLVGVVVLAVIATAVYVLVGSSVAAGGAVAVGFAIALAGSKAGVTHRLTPDRRRKLRGEE